MFGLARAWVTTTDLVAHPWMTPSNPSPLRTGRLKTDGPRLGSTLKTRRPAVSATTVVAAVLVVVLVAGAGYYLLGTGSGGQPSQSVSSTRSSSSTSTASSSST